MKPRPLLQGAGFATLYIGLFAADFLNPTLGNAYHRFFPLTAIYRAILFMSLLLWFVGGVAFFILERLPLRWKRTCWLLPIVLLPWLVFRTMSAMTYGAEFSSVPILMLRFGRWSALAVAVISLVLLIAKSKLYDRWLTGVRIFYIVAGFGLVVIIPRIGLRALGSGPREMAGFQRTDLPNVSPEAPRIVWILMDELSYNQLFASRQPGVQLPNFDRLASTSVVFSDLQPSAPTRESGATTEDVLPSLMLGKVVEELHKSYPGPPSYRSTSAGPWRRFDENDTIFARAQKLGWTTGVAGWYNPYCRLLPHVLDRCIWIYSEPVHEDLSQGLSTKNSVFENLVAMMPFSAKLSCFVPNGATDPVRTHANDYRSMMAEAKDLIQDSRIRFVFIHLPVPHPPGIYDRVHHVFRNSGTYLDNLVLADDSLGALRQAIESTAAAANTTLVVSSDHSWRPWVWRPLTDWSKEEERATGGGKYDQRAVLIVHLPGESAAQRISKPMHVLIAYDILAGLLRGKIQFQFDFNNLIDRQSTQTIPVQAGN
jgi:hypothetical protein